MGHNVVSSTLVGRMNDRTLSENPQNIIEEGDSHNDISSWQILDEQPEIEIMEGENPYQGRRVGVSRSVQEINEESEHSSGGGELCVLVVVKDSQVDRVKNNVTVVTNIPI